MRINLLDAGLRVAGGHPHDINLTLTRALVRLGHDVHIYCHHGITPAVKEEYAQLCAITPLFTIDPYQNTKSFSPELTGIMRNLDGAIVTAAELAKVRAAEVWLWPSIFTHQLLACAFIKTKALISGCLHHPPEFFGKDDPGWWQYAFLQTQKSQLNVRLSVLETETRYAYLPLCFGEPPLVAPYPHDGLAQQSPRQKLQTIGVFGFQRQEKGGTLLRPLLEKLSAQGYSVIFQDSSNHPIESIPGIIQLGHAPSLIHEIAKCDLVLAPYRPEAYIKRGSGIIMNALSCGVPVIAPEGTAPGRLVAQTGAGILFSQYTLNSILNALHSAIANYDSLADAAFVASRDWTKSHGVEKFLNAMIL